MEFPRAQVTVLSPQKTFWEKVTLIHFECNRPALKYNVDRISRHWYDVAMLASSDIGKQAFDDRKLLNEVIRIEKAFYNASCAKYDDCLIGEFRLVPKENYLKLLEDDFNKMLNEKMFYGKQPDFENIMERISVLERRVNSAIYTSAL